MATPTIEDCVGLGRRAIRKRFGVSERQARKLAVAAAALPKFRTPEKPAQVRGQPGQQVTDDESGLDRVITCQGPRIKTLEQLLAAGNVDPEEWTVTKYRLNSWEMANGAGEYFPLFQVKADLERKLLLPIAPAEPVSTVFDVVDAVELTGQGTAMFIPDTQHGFRWNENYTHLTPMHDRKALSCALGIARHVQPSVLVFLGDHLDATEFALKYERTNDVRQTTQPAIDELYWQLRQFRLACPNARILYIAGNHEQRIEKALNERLPEAATLKPANDPLAAMSIPRLLALDSLGIEFVGPYGADYWLWDKIRVTHAPATGVQARVWPEVHGHVHDIHLEAATIHGPNGDISVYPRMSPGSLCACDGTVPGARPRFNWQQGVGFAHLLDGSVHMHVSQIVNGLAVYGGMQFKGVDTSAEVAAATGWPQMAAFGAKA